MTTRYMAAGADPQDDCVHGVDQMDYCAACDMRARTEKARKRALAKAARKQKTLEESARAVLAEHGREDVYLEALGAAVDRQDALKADAAQLAREIAAFGRRCSREEYTDTGEAWELLTAARKLLRTIGKGA